MFVMVTLNCRRDNALDADTVAAHDDRHFLAFGSQDPGTHRLGVFGSKFEDVTDLHRFEDFELAAVTTRTGLARFNRAQVRPLVDLDIAFDSHTANVMVILVGARGHVAAAAKSFISDDKDSPRIFPVEYAPSRISKFHSGCRF